MISGTLRGHHRTRKSNSQQAPRVTKTSAHNASCFVPPVTHGQIEWSKASQSLQHLGTMVKKSNACKHTCDSWFRTCRWQWHMCKRPGLCLSKPFHPQPHTRPNWKTLTLGLSRWVQSVPLNLNSPHQDDLETEIQHVFVTWGFQHLERLERRHSLIALNPTKH